ASHDDLRSMDDIVSHLDISDGLTDISDALVCLEELRFPDPATAYGAALVTCRRARENDGPPSAAVRAAAMLVLSDLQSALEPLEGRVLPGRFRLCAHFQRLEAR